MNFETACRIIEEIATGDKEREAFKEMVRTAEVYRTMYEGAEKRIARYRDVASRPDIAEYVGGDFDPVKGY